MATKNYKYNKIPNSELPTIIVASPSCETIKEEDNNKMIQGKGGEESDASECEEEKSRESLNRRNSISLPNLDDFSTLTKKLSDNCDKIYENENSDNEFKGYTRNVRRKSVLSPRMLRPPADELEAAANSPANSITSVNSIASLLREKIQNLPQTLRKKKSPEYKTKIFVGLLFVAIVVLIVTAYCLYHQKVLAKVYFGNMKLNKAKRTVKIFSENGGDIVQIQLGTTLDYDNVLPCLSKDQRNDGSLCLEWMNRARLYLSFADLGSDVKRYNFEWIALSEDFHPTDCFDMSNAHWYGGGQTAEMAWPLEKGGHFFQPFITGNVETHEWGNVLKRYFINSKAAAIIIDDKTPLYVSIKDMPKKEFCVRAQYDDFAYANRFAPTARLNYSVFTGSNMTELHVFLSEHTLWDGMNRNDGNIIDYFLKEPVWEMPEHKEFLTQGAIDLYTNNMTSTVSILKQGHILFNEYWQEEVGNFELDKIRFPSFDTLMEKLIRRGFRVVFTIQPFVSTESSNFPQAVRQKLLISERDNDKRVPALTRYKSVRSAGVLDITNNRTVAWLLDKLRRIKEAYKIDAFYLDMGVAYNLPRYYRSEELLLNPDEYKTRFVEALQSAEVPLFGVNSAVRRPKSPSFVVLPEFEFSWDGLRMIIPAILSYGIAGYPFLIPGAVGGDYPGPETVALGNDAEDVLHDPELYIRWLQLSAFLPVVRYRHLPSNYDQRNISGIAKALALTRQDKITPRLQTLAKVSLNIGLPLIRPLWMLDADDPACHLAVDEFSIGDEIIVAPILHKGAKQREIYLPAGVWKDGIDHSLRKGNRWIHNYRVEEQEVPYFERLPDDTRF
ncbi:unnamed protein product [Phyllotreta striolata]|uniref:Glycoside hydrolase family 31 n=1 Tax=Phyllotreta striolata TaxID=444603 RepID=A0A9N9XMA2_PHYSR|nr:unnamed protein product [Phyllotreta striolata]